MKVGIYIEPAGDAVGGSELCAAVLAEAYRSEHEVDLIHHKRQLEARTLEQAFDVDLTSVRLRRVEQFSLPQFYGVHNPFERFEQARKWQASLSAPYDLFIGFVHNVPPFCHATAGMLVVLFPFFEREEDLIYRTDQSLVGKHVKRAYYQYEWRARMRSYGCRVSISEFTRRWTKSRWHTDTAVLNPPGADPVAVVPPKQRIILSVGRFSVHAHVKKQEELIATFAGMAAARQAGWTYRCVGGLGTLDEDRMFFNRVNAAAAAGGATVEANLSRVQLDALFSEAGIFWHATGFGVDEEAHPELMEHYGIVTAEAMAYGCVPVVIDRGGQREIVQHGVNGFLWNTLDELREFTSRLIDDEALRQRMAEAALTRAKDLSRTAFVNRARCFAGSLVNRSVERAPSS